MINKTSSAIQPSHDRSSRARSRVSDMWRQLWKSKVQLGSPKEKRSNSCSFKPFRLLLTCQYILNTLSTPAYFWETWNIQACQIAAIFNFLHIYFYILLDIWMYWWKLCQTVTPNDFGFGSFPCSTTTRPIHRWMKVHLKCSVLHVEFVVTYR